MFISNFRSLSSFSSSLIPLALASLYPLTTLAAEPEVIIDPPTIPLSPEETLKTFHIQDGYHLELVLSEPQIKEPVIAVFDGNGRMFVAEMRSYMQDIDGENQFDKVSRISMHAGTNGDGTYDRHTVVIDNLVLPRMILPLDDRLVVCETNSLNFYTYRDTDGDGIADEKNYSTRAASAGGTSSTSPAA